MIDQLNNKTQNNFIWNGSNSKIKNLSITGKYENGWLKNVNVAAKISSLHRSWIKRLFDQNFNDWKTLPLHIIHKSLLTYKQIKNEQRTFQTTMDKP